MNCKIFIGPMSKNIVDIVIEYANKHQMTIGLIPSRRQIDYNSGYVNNWNTKTFSQYVKSKSNNVILVRDHAGPNQGDVEDDGFDSMRDDAIYLDIIHIDVWKVYKNINDGINKTIDYINFCYNINPEIKFEIGTEQSIREFDEIELNKLLFELKKQLKQKVFEQIKYVVIQCGTSLQGIHNTGVFNNFRLSKMIEIVKSYNILTKEHNGDYQPLEIIKHKFDNGLHSINIAPEFGKIETETILKHTEGDVEFFELFFNLCLNCNRWQKWVTPDFNPYKNKKDLILIAGHYVFSNPLFQEKINNIPNLNNLIKKQIENKISQLNSIF